MKEIFVHTPFVLTIAHAPHRIHFDVGVHQVTEYQANHWYVKAHSTEYVPETLMEGGDPISHAEGLEAAELPETTESEDATTEADAITEISTEVEDATAEAEVSAEAEEKTGKSKK